MRTLSPLLTADGWRYTATAGNAPAQPTGYCASWQEPAVNDSRADLKRQYRPQYHSDGHPSAIDACACFMAFEVQLKELAPGSGPPDTRHRCSVDGCTEFTIGLMLLGRRFYFCQLHRSADKSALDMATRARAAIAAPARATKERA